MKIIVVVLACVVVVITVAWLMSKEDPQVITIKKDSTVHSGYVQLIENDQTAPVSIIDATNSGLELLISDQSSPFEVRGFWVHDGPPSFRVIGLSDLKTKGEL